ncbi:hypothetical protein EDD85DRAFT_582065 [Armillaria nabsnona]|nr:hypothetical protein EDD85DRAFT_582065 [Armillaria nabsnona]
MLSCSCSSDEMAYLSVAGPTPFKFPLVAIGNKSYFVLYYPPKVIHSKTCRNIPKPVSYTIKQRNGGNDIYGGFQRRDRATTVPVPSFPLTLKLISGTLAVHKVVNLIPTGVDNSVMRYLHVNSILHGNPSSVDPKQASFFITEPSNVETRGMFPIRDRQATFYQHASGRFLSMNVYHQYTNGDLWGELNMFQVALLLIHSECKIV